MEMNEQCKQDQAEQVLIREFTALEGMQPAHQLVYRLAGKPDGWQLSVQYRADGVERTEHMTLTAPRSKAEQVQRFLYENAAPIENWQELVQELQAAQ